MVVGKIDFAHRSKKVIVSLLNLNMWLLDISVAATVHTPDQSDLVRLFALENVGITRATP